MDCRVIGERSDAVLRTATPGNDLPTSQIPVLFALASCEFWQRLTQHQSLEMLGLLVVDEAGFAAEHFVEQEQLRLRRAPMYVELLDPCLLLRLGQKFLQDCCDGVGLTGFRFPQGAD